MVWLGAWLAYAVRTARAPQYVPEELEAELAADLEADGVDVEALGRGGASRPSGKPDMLAARLGHRVRNRRGLCGRLSDSLPEFTFGTLAGCGAAW